MFILPNEKKVSLLENTCSGFLDFLGEKFNLGYFTDTKFPTLHANFFFRRIYIRAQQQICNQKQI